MFFICRPTLALRLTHVLFPKLIGCLTTQKFFSQTHTATILPNLKPLNSKITCYMRNGLTEEAHKLFDDMSYRNCVTWNTMIRGYFENGKFHKAVNLFEKMPECDIFSYNTVIAGLMQYGDVNGARKVFHGMPCRDVVTWNSMLSGYIRNGMIDEAVKFFDQMPLKNVISWNLVIGGLVNCGNFDLAEKYFEQMSTRDVVSWTIMISGLASAGRVVEACKLFEAMPTRDTRAWNAMMIGYIENGYIQDAEVLFQKMPEKDFESWNRFVIGLVRNWKMKDAIRLFMEMPQKCQRTWNLILLELVRNSLIKEAHAFLEKFPYSDVVSWTNVIVGYFEIGEVATAVKLFALMSTTDTTLWNATIFGLGENDHGEEGLRLYMRMKESGPAPDKATFTSVLTICSNLPSLQFGKQTHAHVVKSGFNCSIAVCNAMTTMYARCGNMQSALLEFSSMSSHDVISWNSIICGFAHHGNGIRALEMFEGMILTDVRPNSITFVGVLSACSHAGLVDQGKYYFDFMKSKCCIQPASEHYTCVVDLLGRYGLIDEAMHFLDRMTADGVEVPASVWGALLGACRNYKNIEIGKIAGERILDLEPYNSGVYLILAEMYVDCGKKQDAERMWARMKEKGVKKQPGCSWIEIKNCGHIFLSGDSSHPEFSRICCTLDLMHLEMGKKFSKSNSFSIIANTSSFGCL
ncbi:Pentatricopeptide repeat-containing protein [Quillaja saponaria]|uniref:Pentatricopeptide repeat-containing protein n=1 Tax=Quillaja saponaria TaxID=32244 RepID=A0AAD7QE68_QUISA|nr:Pentatricopeptide repeat-containing protein [Quillaja saponaria]